MKTTKLLKALGMISILLATSCGVDQADTYTQTQSETAMQGKFDLWQSDNGSWHFNLLAGNYQNLLYSEAYTSRTGALNGMLSVLDNAGFETNYKVKEGRDGQFYLSLRARNHRSIATSEGYASSYNARRAIDACGRAVEGYLAYWDVNSGARAQVFEGVTGQFRFNIYSANGEVILTSESYSTEASALNGAFSVVENGVWQESYEVVESASGGFYLNLRAENSQIIATSEVYTKRSNAIRARDAIVNLLPSIELI